MFGIFIKENGSKFQGLTRLFDIGCITSNSSLNTDPQQELAALRQSAAALLARR